MSRHLYEEQPLDRLLLMGRALEGSRPLAGGRMLAAVLTRDDFAAAGGRDTEGIVEVMRGVRGMRAAALVSEAGPRGHVPRVAADGRPGRRRRRRSPARRAAAGIARRPGSARPARRTTSWSGSTRRWARVSTPPTGPMADAAVAPAPALWLVDKPAGPTSHDVVAMARRQVGRKVKVGHCGTLDPFATGLLVRARGPGDPARART